MRIGEASQLTAFAIVQRAKANVAVRSGALRDKLGYSFDPRTGRAKVGIEKGTVIVAIGEGGSALHSKGAISETPSHIGHLVEFGHADRTAGPHPFMIPAAEAERDLYLQRCRKSGGDIERDMASGGGLL